MSEPGGDALYDTPPRDAGYDPAELVPGPAQAGPDQDAAPPAPDDALPEFDPAVRDDFKGLMYLGALSREFSWLGHRFHIRTLRSDELVEVPLIVRAYEGSEGYPRALQGAVTSACVVTVDGAPIPVLPLAKDESELRLRYRWVMGNWFPPVLDRVYQEYILLEARVREVIQAMEKALG